jgi:hypothetical protein
MNEPMIQEGFTGRCQKVLQVAKDLYQRRPDWVTFFRETLGVNGAARSVFPNQDNYLKFEQSPEYTEIQTMVANLRTAKVRGGGKDEATRVITVRLPESLHEALKKEADDHRTSMNKLCISKLLQVLIENEAAEAASRAAAAQAPTPMAQPPVFRQQTNPIPAAQPVRPSGQAAPTNFRSTWQQGE